MQCNGISITTKIERSNIQDLLIGFSAKTLEVLSLDLSSMVSLIYLASSSISLEYIL